MASILRMNIVLKVSIFAHTYIKYTFVCMETTNVELSNWLYYICRWPTVKEHHWDSQQDLINWKILLHLFFNETYFKLLVFKSLQDNSCTIYMWSISSVVLVAFWWWASLDKTCKGCILLLESIVALDGRNQS